jgi:predicted nucleic acid-binding protein
MTKKFYLDTAIWRDYFEDRGDGTRPLGEFAFQFLRKCRETNAVVFVSDVVVLELKIRLSEKQSKELFSSFEGLITWLKASAQQTSEAREEWRKRGKSLPFKDVLHAIIARDNKAVLIARDKHFFDSLSSIVEMQKPEDVDFI